MDTTPLAEYRCSCNRLLFRGVVLSTRIQIKCKRCNALVPFGPNGAEDALFHYGLIVSNDGMITEASDTAPTILGYPREELIGMRLGMLSPYQPASVHHTKKFPYPVSFDGEHCTKSGSRIPVRTWIEYLDTSPHQLEMHLFEALHPKQETLFRDAPARDGLKIHTLLAEVDREGRYVYVSDALCKFFGQDAFMLLGSHMFDTFASDRKENYCTWFRDMADARVAYSISDVPVMIDEGDTRMLSAHLTPGYRDDGCLRGYSVVFEEKK